MDTHDTNASSPLALIIGWGGTVASIVLDKVVENDSLLLDIWHFLPGVISTAFVIWKWWVAVEDRKKKQENNKTKQDKE